MNTRIRELAKQADDGYTGNNGDDMGHALVGEDAIEKFARLIILEYKKEEKESRREIKSKLGYSRIGLNNV